MNTKQATSDNGSVQVANGNVPFANGNVQVANAYRVRVSHAPRILEGRNWAPKTYKFDSNQFTTDTQYSNNSTNYSYISGQEKESSDDQIATFKNTTNVHLVCNRQYQIDIKHDIKFGNNKKQASTLERATEHSLTSRESFPGKQNVSAHSTPIEEETAFDNSYTDDMSDKGSLPLPRGIVNPNYPGFQHLAHTLQDYSSNIENFYQSENEMTDDDIDIEITDATCDVVTKQHEMNLDYTNGNNITAAIVSNTDHDRMLEAKLEIISQNEIPDLLKTLSKNNNTDINCFELNCSETDIENNFNTSDIIGDFNKEIEDEIKHVLNYNINVQDDLDELRKDIKDNFKEPIESTINNISDVVNHVIKKLVETQCDMTESEIIKQINPFDGIANNEAQIEMSSEEKARNAINKMNVTRPSFLMIEDNINNKIIEDALLSNGKDEISGYVHNEYDADKLSENVENTIKQLSTELRKIIPKLDELRDRENLFVMNKSVSLTVMDGNCNQLASSSKTYTTYNALAAKVPREEIRYAKQRDIDTTVKKYALRSRTNVKTTRDRASGAGAADLASSSQHQAHSSASVQTNEDSDLGYFDVYNIETALPTLDIDAIESHIKAAKDAERRKRNDREEIRKRLAMGVESDEYYSLGHVGSERPGKKPSLHSRLQSGKNLQICFLNETASDNESQASDVERSTHTYSGSSRSLSKSSIFSKSNYSLNNHPYQTRPLSVNISKPDKHNAVQSGSKLRPISLSLKSAKTRSTSQSLGHIELRESDFHALQSTLQTEARMALAQAKELARLQMERSRSARATSPVSLMVRRSLQLAAPSPAPCAAAPAAPPPARRLSRRLLTGMNVAQLQVIVNSLHGEIASLSEALVRLLMARDELHMGQDSMLVDIEDLTRYLGVKEQTKKSKGGKSGVRRLAALVHK